MKKKVLAVILAIVSVAALAACGSNGAAEPKAGGSAATEKSSSTSADTTIKIGAKSFSESKILGELYALALEDAGYKVEREFEVSDNLIHQAVCDGQIDMYPEYTGTSLLTILDQPMETDPQITYDKVKEMYAEKFNLDVLDMCEASNGNGLSMRADVAEKYGIKSISDLQANADKIRFGGTSDTFEREDGLPGLEQTYGTFKFKSKNTFDNSLKYQAMANDEVDCVPAYTTDAQLSSDEFVLLDDDKHFWPPYNIIPVVRQEVIDAHPDVAEIINKISAAIDTETMTKIIQYAHNTEVPILSYNNETELSAIVNLVYLSARDQYRVEREEKAGKGFVDFIFYPVRYDQDCIILELKVDHSPEDAIAQIKEKDYALRFRGKTAEKNKYTGRILAVGISYNKETKEHDCKVEEI